MALKVPRFARDDSAFGASRNREGFKLMRVGIEVGGTFTDLVAVEGGQGRGRQGPEHAAQAGHRRVRGAHRVGHRPRAVEDLVHGSTVATNAILERKGARVAFVATRASATSCSCSATTGATSTTSATPSPRRRCAAATASRRRSGSTPTAGRSGRSTRPRSRRADPGARGARRLSTRSRSACFKAYASRAREAPGAADHRGAARRAASPAAIEWRASSASSSAPRRRCCRPMCSR